MAETPSTMLPLGTPAPDFRLPEPGGSEVSLADLADAKGLLVVFMCNHCPFVKHVADELAAFAREYQLRGLAIVGINANDVENPKYAEDAPEKMIEEKKARGYVFPYLLDETQEVAKAFKAACTPDFFLFDGKRKLVYRGQFDDSRPSNGRPVTGRDLRAAADRVLAGEPVPEDQTPSIGCNIKWKPGNEPRDF